MSKHKTSSHPSAETPAIAALLAAGVHFTPHAYDHERTNTDFGAEAATQLDLDPNRVYKTLMTEGDNGLIVAIVPVAGRLNLKALANAAGVKKAKMADPKVAERKTGYIVGGISPLGQKNAAPTFLDSGASAFETIFVSGGKRGFDVELAPQDLLSVVRGSFAPIAE